MYWHRYLTVKLFYRDDYTPDEYEPHFFRPAREEGAFYCLTMDPTIWSHSMTVLADAMVFDDTPFKVRVGEVKTPYHEMVSLPVVLSTNSIIHMCGCFSETQAPERG